MTSSTPGGPAPGRSGARVPVPGRLHFRMHEGARAEPVLAAWGITTEGRPVLVGLAAGASESTDAWAGFLDELAAGGCARRCWSSPTAPPG